MLQFFLFFKKKKKRKRVWCFFPSGWFNSHRVDEDECFDRLDDVRILLPASFVENAINGSRWSRFNWTLNTEIDFRDREWLSGHYFHKRLLQIFSERRFLSLLTKLLPWTIRVCPKKKTTSFLPHCETPVCMRCTVTQFAPESFGLCPFRGLCVMEFELSHTNLVSRIEERSKKRNSRLLGD